MKVGSTKYPKARLRELNTYEKRGLRNEFSLIAFIERGSALRLESYFHQVADWLGLAIPEELCEIPSAEAGDLLAAMAGWMGYSFEPRPLAKCPSLRVSRRAWWVPR